ncbi:MAG: LOG family protein [bacterium]|nr:LOG family protein [bacterium]
MAVYGSSRAFPGDGVYEQGVELGALLGEAGFGVVNGGYEGLMEAVSSGAASVGARAIGVTAPSLFPTRAGGNRFLTEEIPAAGLIDRIKIMAEMACASIVMPGSIGTLTELAVAWNDSYLVERRGLPANPIIAFRVAWEGIVGSLVEELRTEPGLVSMVDTPSEAVEVLTLSLPGYP